MKSKLLIILPAIIFLACKSDPKEETGVQLGEESVVRLTVYDATRVTRAAGQNEETAIGDEANIDPAKGISVVVFNDDGTVAYPGVSDPVHLTLTETGSGTGVYTSSAFTITSGQKYFYVFANGENNLISQPVGTRSPFINRTIATTLDASDKLSIASPNFLMGALWSELKTAPEGGTTLAPANVPLTIGRLSSKVILKDVSQGTQSAMAGVFSDPVYRLGTIPRKIFLVGNNNEALPTPPALGHGVVTSAVHTAAVVADGGDANFQQYTATWENMDNPFYTVENTTEPDIDGYQYYGNTTYIQIRTKYEPDPAEVSKVDDLTPQNSFTGPTFYTARLISDGKRLIFEDDPRVLANNPNPDIDQQTVEVYTDGLNYHKFPIHDNEIGLPEVQRNSVLRNHYYEYTVTSIADLGSPGENVDPREPIEKETTLKIEVRVAPWSKISNNNLPI